MRRFALLSLLALGCPKTTPPQPPAPEARCGVHADGSQTFGILHINDVYRIEGLLDGTGGLARLRRLRAELEADCPDLLMTHGGDFLSPSLLTKSTNKEVDPERKVQTDGAHMVDLLSRLDGDPEAFDPHMFVAIGNHEFDTIKTGSDFAKMASQSDFRWIDTNLRWLADGEEPAPESERFMSHAVVAFGDLEVGILGMTLDMKSKDAEGNVKLKRPYFDTDDDHAAVARSTLAEMGEVDVHLGVTHLDVNDDLALMEAVPELDLILGGHNHTAMTRATADGRLVLKADADAATVRVAYVTVAADGSISVEHDAHDDVVGTILSGEGDPDMQAAVDEWEAGLAREFCGEADLKCLEVKLTETGNDFVGKELEIRRFETNVGDLAADLALGAYAEQGAQLAFMNSGGMRLNQTIPKGADFTRRQQEELFPYDAPVFLVEITGAELQGVADRAVEAWEGNGHWLQVSGWGFIHDPEANDGKGSATRLHLLPADGEPVPIDPEATYKAVVNEYLVTDKYGDRDGYKFEVRYIGEVPASPPDVKVLFGAHLKQAPVTTLSTDGRVCNTTRPEAPCRIPAE